MIRILDGKKARDFYKNQLIERAKKCAPGLAIIQIGENASSTVYINQKKKFGHEIGVRVEHKIFSETADQADIMSHIAPLNLRSDIHGIIIQLPVPPRFDTDKLLSYIDPRKDVDGLVQNSIHTPATAKGVKALLDFYTIPARDKKVVVIGRSRLVGKPLAQLFTQEGAVVSVCHSETPNTKEISRTADILIVAIGKPHMITHEYIKPGAVVVDVGITNIEGKVVGDVDYEDVVPTVSAITPVPGGVGPMTVLSLFDNLIHSAEMACRER